MKDPRLTLHELTYVPDDWIEFHGDYKKTMQDIRLKDGTELHKYWPNAGAFRSTDGGKDYDYSEVTHVRKNKDTII